MTRVSRKNLCTESARKTFYTIVLSGCIAVGFQCIEENSHRCFHAQVLDILSQYPTEVCHTWPHYIPYFNENLVNRQNCNFLLL